MITTAILRAIMPNVGVRADWAADALEAARAKWVGDDPLAVAHWLAQLAHESGQLRYVRELATGDAYEGRHDLGNTQPGDGRRFRGRGFIQLTGRANYGAYMQASGVDVLGQPDLLEDVTLAADVSGWFWSANRVWARTEGAGDRVLAITKIINGGTNGIDSRRAFFDRAQRALSIQGRTAPTQQPPAPIEHRDWPTETAAPTGPAVPIGEAMNYGEPTMDPLTIAGFALPLLKEFIPEISKIFGPRSEVSERNVKAATAIIDVATQAAGAVNALDAVQKMQADPAVVETVRAAVLPALELVEAGGGGIAGARKAEADGQAAGWVWYRSGVFIVGLLMLPLVYMAAAAVLFPAVGGSDWPSEVRASALMMILGLASVIAAFWFGASNKPSVPSK